MAEAHSVAALSFTLTHDGVSVSYDQELLRDIWHAFSRAYKRRLARFKNDFLTGIFPANTYSFCSVIISLTIFSVFHRDLSFGIVPFVEHYIFGFLFGCGIISQILSLLVCGALIWFVAIQTLRLTLKAFLSYKGWMYESPHSKEISTPTKLWLMALHLISKSDPMLHSFQGALPHLPLPSLEETLQKHLRSMRPLCSDEEYNELVELTDKFCKGIGRRLQRYLVIKWILSINYVTDWWEEFVYLRQRSPIMINSNYYGFDTLREHPTHSQSARAANITYAALTFRRMVERQQVKPFAVSPRTKVPFCTMQYERLFNSCRVPGEESDRFHHWDDSKHVAVLCKGCWFKLPVHTGKRLHEPCELQVAFQSILDSALTPAPGEEDLAALTAGDRTAWALARKKYFSAGVNKTSLHAIERSAFVVVLDQEEFDYDPDEPSKLDSWACNLLHGKAKDRWFDKSFNFVIYKNGRMGINAEHSWGDAAIMAHFMEYCLITDLCQQGYDDKGNTFGTPVQSSRPERLRWNLSDEVQAVIHNSLSTATALIEDVEMALLVWTEYGKGLIKNLRVSPDAFLQMTLQLTYFRNQGKFALTYEAAMTRLYREGRTETVRSCTMESCDFVRAMLDPKQTREERCRLLRKASERHQELYRAAMCGKGVDRHLFALYVVKRYLEEESPFLDKIFPPTYLLSTSQTPLNQCTEEAKCMTPQQKANFVSAGGGFGPVADEGYGVSYNIAGEHQISFHISSKKSAKNTSSAGFRNDLVKSLREMRDLFVDEVRNTETFEVVEGAL
uniref:carnitine O-palmitoyltransferase n=1 Tax=Parascaris univalens TaxID=6257 RepID=A0A915B095_PARUN